MGNWRGEGGTDSGVVGDIIGDDGGEEELAFFKHI